MTDLILDPLFVEGPNVPQGSKVVGLNRTTGKVFMHEAAGERHARRRAMITAMARQHMADHGLTEAYAGPVAVRLTFHRLRGTGDYGTGLKTSKVLKPSASPFPSKAPDVDKLVRLVLDSLTNVVYVDDGQVVRLGAEKVWTDRWTGREGVTIYIKFIEETP